MDSESVGQQVRVDAVLGANTRHSLVHEETERVLDDLGGTALAPLLLGLSPQERRHLVVHGGRALGEGLDRTILGFQGGQGLDRGAHEALDPIDREDRWFGPVEILRLRVRIGGDAEQHQPEHQALRRIHRTEVGEAEVKR